MSEERPGGDSGPTGPGAGEGAPGGRSSTPGDDAASVPIPDYEVEQYFPRQRFSGTQISELREEYGYIRTFFKTRPHRYRELQRWLNQARFGTTYDRYLTASAKYALAAGLIGVLLGAVIAVLLANSGLLGGVSSPVRSSSPVAYVLAANKVPLLSTAVTLLTGAFAAAAVWFGRYYYPYNEVTTRARSVNILLPHGIVFMYALSYGGMNLYEVIEEIADAEDAYGAVAEEFDMVVRDVELFGNDLYTALRNARNLTPSENFESFLDDMVSVLDAGGDVTEFLADQGDRYLERAHEEQEDFLETLAVLSEVFIAAFVAAPLFLIVILVVISLLGGSSVSQLVLLTYVVLPVAMAGFTLLISILSEPYAQPAAGLSEAPGENAVDAAALEGDEEFLAYAAARRWEPLKAFAADPLAAVRGRPALVLLLSVPLAVVFAGAVALGTELSMASLLAAPVTTTTWVAVFPALVAVVPYAFFHELETGRAGIIARRFPNTLHILASANQMGISFTEALEVVSRWSTGGLSEELRKLRNDIVWSGDTTSALLRFANRLRVPQLARPVKLIAEGARSTGDLATILTVAAEDTRNRYRLVRNRRRAMASYTAVVIIGFLVYLLVIALLDASYLTPLAEIGESAPAPGQPGVPFNVAAVPVETYRLLFFHSVLIQGAGSGVLAGYLANDDLPSGLKYAVAMVAIAVVTFTVI